MAIKLYDISHWQEDQSKQTEGTRDKRVILSPDDGATYYFKTSLLRRGRDYRTEFWSEVIAGVIGQLLGFDVLHYDVALLRENTGQTLVGCLSKSLYGSQEGMLSGYNLLVHYDPAFKDRFKDKGYHSLWLIAEALKEFGLQYFLSNVLECLIFDCIIGNTDRHSENWAFILQPKRFDDGELRLQARYSSIYDSGSSLGRELSEERIAQLLRKREDFERYIERGKPDIHVRHLEAYNFWDNLRILAREYKDDVQVVNQRLIEVWRENVIRDMVISIDSEVSDGIPSEHQLSGLRKEFVAQLINERIKRTIRTIIDESDISIF